MRRVETVDDSPKCSRHLKSAAAWVCRGCGKNLCQLCAALKPIYPTEITVCAHCGELVDVLTVHRSRFPYGARLRGAFRYPLGVVGITSMVLVSLVVGAGAFLFGLASPYQKPALFAITAGVFWAYVFHLIRATARGDQEVGPPEFGDFMSSMVSPAIRGTVASAFVWVPAAAYVKFMYGFAILQTPWLLAPDPVAWAVVVAGIAYVPMALVIAATGGPIVRIVNPFLAVAYMARLGADYGKAVAMVALLLVLEGGVVGGTFWLSRELPFPFLIHLVGRALAMYVPFVLAHALGLLLYVRGDLLGWGVPEDYQMPVFPGAVPKAKYVERARGGVPVASQPPRTIEVDETAPPPPAPPRPRPTSLSADPGQVDLAWNPPPSSDQPPEVAIAEAVAQENLDLAVSLYQANSTLSGRLLSPECHLAVGQGAAARGNFALAVQALKAAGSVNPDNPVAAKALVILARLYAERLGDGPAARQLYSFVVQRYPGTSAARFAQGQLAARA